MQGGEIWDEYPIERIPENGEVRVHNSGSDCCVIGSGYPLSDKNL